MAARTAGEIERGKRRKRLLQGLLLGAAAVGLPAVANRLVSRRVGRLPPPRWGRLSHWTWRHGEIAFRRLGQGPPLVLVHSLGPGHDSEQWRPAAERLARGHQVLAPDLLGWGRSDKPDLAYDPALYVELIGDFLTSVAGGRAAVVAAGASAAYAVAAAATHPKRVRALGLVCPVGLAAHRGTAEVKDAALHGLLRLPVLGRSAINLYTSRSGLAHHLRHEVFAAPERVDAALVERHWRVSHQPGAQKALAAFLAGRLDHPVEELLAGLGMPVWLGWGRRSVYPPVETADRWLRHLEAELVVFDDSGSHPHSEQPVAFVRALEGFLGEAPS